MSMVYFIVGSIYFFVMFFSTAIVGFYLLKGGRKSVTVSKLMVAILFALQIFLLLFNFGDCGDGPGAYQFIQRFGKSASYSCHLTPLFSEAMVKFFVLYLLPGYALLLPIIVFWSLDFRSTAKTFIMEHFGTDALKKNI